MVTESSIIHQCTICVSTLFMLRFVLERKTFSFHLFWCWSYWIVSGGSLNWNVLSSCYWCSGNSGILGHLCLVCLFVFLLLIVEHEYFVPAVSALNVCLCYFSSVGKAVSVRWVCAWATHVLSGWGSVHFPAQATVCPLVLCDSWEFPHLQPSVSSGRKLWVICASLECLLESQCVFVHDFAGFISFLKMYQMCGKSFTPSHKGVWLKAKTIAPVLSSTQPLLWGFLWMPSSSRECQIRWSKRTWRKHLTLVRLFACNLIIFTSCCTSSSCTAICQWAAPRQPL